MSLSPNAGLSCTPFSLKVSEADFFDTTDHFYPDLRLWERRAFSSDASESFQDAAVSRRDQPTNAPSGIKR